MNHIIYVALLSLLSATSFAATSSKTGPNPLQLYEQAPVLLGVFLEAICTQDIAGLEKLDPDLGKVSRYYGYSTPKDAYAKWISDFAPLCESRQQAEEDANLVLEGTRLSISWGNNWLEYFDWRDGRWLRFVPGRGSLEQLELAAKRDSHFLLWLWSLPPTGARYEIRVNSKQVLERVLFSDRSEKWPIDWYLGSGANTVEVKATPGFIYLFEASPEKVEGKPVKNSSAIQRFVEFKSAVDFDFEVPAPLEGENSRSFVVTQYSNGSTLSEIIVPMSHDYEREVEIQGLLSGKEVVAGRTKVRIRWVAGRFVGHFSYRPANTAMSAHVPFRLSQCFWRAERAPDNCSDKVVLEGGKEDTLPKKYHVKLPAK